MSLGATWRGNSLTYGPPYLREEYVECACGSEELEGSMQFFCGGCEEAVCRTCCRCRKLGRLMLLTGRCEGCVVGYLEDLLDEDMCEVARRELVRSIREELK